jgi:hypothetical protein
MHGRRTAAIRARVCRGYEALAQSSGEPEGILGRTARQTRALSVGRSSSACASHESSRAASRRW